MLRGAPSYGRLTSIAVAEKTIRRVQPRIQKQAQIDLAAGPWTASQHWRARRGTLVLTSGQSSGCTATLTSIVSAANVPRATVGSGRNGEHYENNLCDNTVKSTVALL